MNVNSGAQLTGAGRISTPAVSRQGQRRAAFADPRRGEVVTTRVGLRMPLDLDFADWKRAGRQLAGVVDSSSWWLGDWLVYGKDNYADRYQRGISAAGLKYQTLRNYAWVSRRFELNRRRAKLTFQHHAEVASLLLDQQERWLDRAEEMKWTTKQLRNAIRDAGKNGYGEGGSPALTRRLAVPGSRVQWWRKAAEQSGIDFDRWVLVTLDRAAGQILEDEEKASELNV
ncbi:LmbU family transcriptional regulator [Streptomyces sp. N2A]|uniref:LmbU family transcriptional regulator n=1 Tax=Streptomyces sp. N2A TaxID=3073936 RepID=UPI00287030A1|nr:LmbU family transcriptional regulator [Streptomyces sp. N2A]